MAYSRRKRFFRKARRVGSSLMRGATTASKALAVASTALKSARYLRSVLNVEHKFLDSNSVPLANASAWTLDNLLMDIPQGDTPSSRDGNQVKIKSLRLRGIVSRNANAVPTTASNFFRMVVFIDKEPTVGAPVQTGTGGLFAINAVYSLYNYETMLTKRYTILKDITWKLDPDHRSIPIKYSKTLNMVSRWNSTTGASQTNNKLYVAYLSDVPLATIDYDATVSSRVTYVDN